MLYEYGKYIPISGDDIDRELSKISRRKDKVMMGRTGQMVKVLVIHNAVDKENYVSTHTCQSSVNTELDTYVEEQWGQISSEVEGGFHNATNPVGFWFENTSDTYEIHDCEVMA